MEININQKPISIGDKYKIFIDGQESYRAARKLFKLLPVVVLYKNDGDIPRITIRKRFTFFKASYVLKREDSSILEFKTISFWKRHYQCLVGKDMYDVYGHRGRKFSIYKNDVQVAFWDKQAVSWFAGDNYMIMADKNSDAELLISFCLVIDNFRSDDHDGKALTVDIGGIGPQAKAFDSNWEPKV